MQPGPGVPEPAPGTPADLRLAERHRRHLGRARSNHALLHARFAHLWTVRDGRLASVYQVTDTAAWRDALDARVARPG